MRAISDTNNAIAQPRLGERIVQISEAVSELHGLIVTTRERVFGPAVQSYVTTADGANNTPTQDSYVGTLDAINGQLMDALAHARALSANL